jgi:hypothetical protein
MAVLAFASASPAAIIGSDLKPAPTPSQGYGCGTGATCMVMQTSIPGNPHPMKAPFDGVITKWRMRKGPEGNGQRNPVRLRVVRRVQSAHLRGGGDPGTGHWRVVRQSAKEKLDAQAGVSVFHAHLRVRKGDRIAMKLKGDFVQITVHDPPALFKSWFPAPAVGSTTKPTFDDPGAEFLWNAKIDRR